MSPLWRDEISLYVGPRKVALVRRASGLRPKVVASTELPVEDGSIGNSAPALARLGELLAESIWRNAAVRVVVADAWVRYGIVPAPSARLDARGRRAHARFVLGDSYGDAIADWDVAVEAGPPGHAMVAAAMPAGLRAELKALLAGAGNRIVSLRPQLVVAFNAWRSRLPEEAWFVTLEDGWRSAVYLTHGVWEQVHFARLSGDAAVDLERLQAFARLIHTGPNDPPMFIEAPRWMRERIQRRITGFDWLEADEAGFPASHELALLLQASA